MQELLIWLIFAVAVAYLGHRVYRSFLVKEAGCGKGCGCAVDSKTQSAGAVTKQK